MPLETKRKEWLRDYLNEKIKRALANQQAYYRSSNRCQRWDRFLNVSLVVISAIASAKLFQGGDQSIATAVAVLALVGTAISAAKPHFELPQRTKSYREAGVGWTVLRNELEEQLVEVDLDDVEWSEARKNLLELLKRWNALVKSSPNIPDREYRVALRAKEDAGAIRLSADQAKAAGA